MENIFFLPGIDGSLQNSINFDKVCDSKLAANGLVDRYPFTFSLTTNMVLWNVLLKRIVIFLIYIRWSKTEVSQKTWDRLNLSACCLTMLNTIGLLTAHHSPSFLQFSIQEDTVITVEVVYRATVPFPGIYHDIEIMIFFQRQKQVSTSYLVSHFNLTEKEDSMPRSFNALSSSYYLNGVRWNYTLSPGQYFCQ